MSQKFIEIKNIHKSYFNRQKLVKEALININLDLQKGEIVSLLGVNGAGKTTLSNIIATLHPPTRGEIFFEGKSIYKELNRYRKIVGFCPQNQNLDANLTLYENLFFQGSHYGLKKEQIFRNAHELMNQFKLEQYEKSNIRELSGGYRQRFLIARSLVHSPELLILDEPTVGLDPQVRHSLWDLILNLKKEGMTILLTTHYLDEAERLSDRVCVIDSGRNKIIDTPENLKKNLEKNNLEEVFLDLLKTEEKV